MEGQLSEYSTVTINKSAASVNGLNQFKGYADVVNGNNDIVVKAVDQNHNTKNQKYAINHVAQDEFSYAYDLNGNLTTETNITQGTTRTFEWDSADNLVAINAGTKRSEFTYNAQKQRIGIKEKISGVVTYDKKFQWAGSTIIEQRSSDGATVEKEYLGFGEYTHLAGVDTKYYYFTDHQGSVREVLNDSKTVVAKYDYSIWGTRTKVSGAYDTEIGYTGHFTHVTSGLDLTHFRVYDSKLGRWLSPEPLGEGENLNLYRLGYNSPLNGFDIDGLGFWSSYGSALFRGAVFAAIVAVHVTAAVIAFPVIAATVTVVGTTLLVVGAAAQVHRSLSYKNLNEEQRGEYWADTTLLAVGATLSASAALKVKPGLKDETLVVRGGTCKAKQFTNGSGVTTDSNGNLQNVSVNSVNGADLGVVTNGIPNNQVGVTTVGAIRAVGGKVVPSASARNPNHATLSDITATIAEELFCPTVKNPNAK